MQVCKCIDIHVCKYAWVHVYINASMQIYSYSQLRQSWVIYWPYYSQCMQNYAKYRKYKAIYTNSYLKLWPDLANLLNLSVDMTKSCKCWVRLIIMQNYSQNKLCLIHSQTPFSSALVASDINLG